MTHLKLFTSESVTEGHPDKICDQISDAILDDLLSQDVNSRVAVEALVTTGLVQVAGEVTTEGYADVERLVRRKIAEIGYDSPDLGFDARSCGIIISIGRQSPDIAAGVANSLEQQIGKAVDANDSQGAGDQGIMFGYATDETANLMPIAIDTAHRLGQRLAEVRKYKTLGYLRPDGTTQVTIGFDGNAPKTVETVVVSAQHSNEIEIEQLRNDIRKLVIEPVLAETGLDYGGYQSKINPTGSFIIGGPHGDAGLTGRKIIVDTYGGASRHGGGAFSGKDPSKVDRSAAYAMRWVAKNVVAAGLAKRVEIQVAYAIGVAHPVGLYVETFGTGAYAESDIQDAIAKVFDLRPRAIIEELDLLRPIYSKTSTYGHFGREDAGFTWEVTNRVDALRKAIKIK
jgi:S-adenosylmethionine synthetase